MQRVLFDPSPWHGNGLIDDRYGDGGTLRIEFPSDDLWEITSSLVRDAAGRLLLTGNSTATVSVIFETLDGSAQSGKVYEPQSGRLGWADGESGIKTITKDLIDDATGEGLESFRLRLSGATGGLLLTANETTVYIDNDDPCYKYRHAEHVTALQLTD